MHVSYFHGTKGDYVQVVSHRDQDQNLKALGFVRSVDDLPDGNSTADEQVETKVIGPQQIDVRAAVRECIDKEEVEALILSTIGVDIDKRGSLDTVKGKALATIEAHASER